MLASANSRLRFFSRYQQLMPTTKKHPAPSRTIPYGRIYLTATGDVATAQKSTISLRTVSGLNSMPTGCCIHALATRIHQAEIVAPKPVSQVEAIGKRLLTLPHPKQHDGYDKWGFHKRMPQIAFNANWSTEDKPPLQSQGE